MITENRTPAFLASTSVERVTYDNQARFLKNLFVPAQKKLSVKMDFWQPATADETFISHGVQPTATKQNRNHFIPQVVEPYSVLECVIYLFIQDCHSLLLQLSDFVRGGYVWGYVSLKILVMDHALEYKDILEEKKMCM